MKIDYSTSALLIVDLQNDFCPGGALAIQDGDAIAEPLNRLSSIFAAKGGRVIATQDWHPASHASFASSHGKAPGEIIDLPEVKGQFLWPDHCIEGTLGADFHKKLNLNPVNLIIRKGFRKELDSYSAFFENDRLTSTGLDAYLKGLNIKTLVIGGLATDYCVYYSAVDAINLGYTVILPLDTVKGVNLPPGSVEKALNELEKLGAKLIESGEIDG